jgi:serine/threonine protein kinase
LRLEPGTTLQHYRLVEKIGAGGMGVVWKALDTTLDREIALKVLPDDVAADPDRLARFEREAKALAALDHPNIVTIHTVQQAAGVRFITMELVGGAPLTKSIPKGGMPPAELLRVGATLADALEAAHAKGVVHRDLKPANVMVGGDGRVRVLDFGLAKLNRPEADGDATQAVTATATGIGLVVGTLPYMSPEQLKGEEVDHRTDIFSLGVMLYEMATGSHPFPAKSNAERVASILTGTPRPTNEVRDDLPEGLQRVIERSIAKDPTRRFETAGQLRDELQSIERGQAVAGAGPRDATVTEPEKTARPRSREASSKREVDLGSALRKAIEAGGESSRVALSLLREEKRDKERKEAAGYVLGGSITSAAGVALMPFLGFMIPDRPVWPVGLIPIVVGIVMILWGRHSLKRLTEDG